MWQQTSGKEVWGGTFRDFFIRIGARYRRIRKRPKGKTSLQFYAYKTKKLQELVQQEKDGLLNLYYGEEIHICTEGDVSYGWQFRCEDIHIMSERGLKLSIFLHDRPQQQV
nr:hypothetical protein [uncultured Prevotella sp.]